MSPEKGLHGTVRRILTLFSLLLAFWAAPAGAQAPYGYIVTESVLLPDTLFEQYLAGSFTLSILRQARDSVEAELIRTAESILPVPDSIVAAGERFLDSGNRSGRWPQTLEEAADAPGPRWWWHRWNRIWLPYALTGAAVQHFVTELRGLARDPYGEPGVRVTGSFEYRASVDHTGGLPVVHLEMRWRYLCGGRCGLWFSHERTVYFGEDGNVMRVEGDSPPHFVVS